ncbi:MAG: hypothetical protein WCB57_14885 [Pseudonocardiaceae bacterium]
MLAADLAAPLWARHAASIAAEEFQRRARMEDYRAEATAAEQRNEQEP